MIILLVSLAVAGCGRPPANTHTTSWTVSGFLLTPQAGTNTIDLEVRRCQEALRAADEQSGPTLLARLGWLFVTKARLSSNPSFYNLAEHCGRRLLELDPSDPEAMLMQGHAAQNQHRFAEAEQLARRAIETRETAAAYGLLGDAVMEQGCLPEAIEAYQKMVNLRPDLHAYARIAHVRWLKGQVTGAIEAMELAVAASSPANPEAAAWVRTGLARYCFQANQAERAQALCARVLDTLPTYAPACFLQGRLLLAAGEHVRALDSLRLAVSVNPTPEYLWMLLEALQAAGLTQEAGEVETRLRRQGPYTDPRTYALFLATRGDRTDLALRLAEEEINERRDIFAHDTLAWALAARGEWDQAAEEITRALSEGTEDGRLFLHAAIIAARAGRSEEANSWRIKLRPLLHLLLPSERALLAEASLAAL